MKRVSKQKKTQIMSVTYQQQQILITDKLNICFQSKLFTVFVVNQNINI